MSGRSAWSSARRRDLGLLPLPACGGGLGRGWRARILCAPSLSLPRKRGSRTHRVRCEGGKRAECEESALSPGPNPTPPRALLGARTNGAATHVEGALAACGGAGGVRGLERRRPPPPSRLLRRLRRARPIQRRRLAAPPRRPRSSSAERRVGEG